MRRLKGAALTPGVSSVGVVTVATNRYLNYWREMAMTADQHLAPGAGLTFYVFTDQPNEARRFSAELSRSQVFPIRISNLGWPEATLLRYEVFSEFWHRVREDVIAHLDADMIVARPTYIHPRPELWPNGIAFVRHPGFRRPSQGRRLQLYLKSPRYLKGDFACWCRHGALGSWETSRQSLAYVPRKMRNVYVCGGTWMGLRESLGDMISMLADRTAVDTSRGVVATWHDESHLNWYASRHEHFLFDSEKCFAPGYRNLRDLNPEIIAVDKGEDRTR